MKRIYLAGPISKGDPYNNVKQADDAMKKLVEAGFAVFNPMLSMFAGGAKKVHQHMGWGPPKSAAMAYAKTDHNLLTYDQWLASDKAWIDVCDAVCWLPGESKGADIETAYAQDKGIPVFFGPDAVIAHFAPPVDHVLPVARFLSNTPLSTGAIGIGRVGRMHPDYDTWEAVRPGQTYVYKHVATGERSVRSRICLDRWEGLLRDIPASFFSDVTDEASTYAALCKRATALDRCFFLKGRVL